MKDMWRKKCERRELTPREGHFAEKKKDFTAFLITFERQKLFGWGFLQSKAYRIFFFPTH